MERKVYDGVVNTKDKYTCPCEKNCCVDHMVEYGSDDSHDCVKSECGNFCEEAYRAHCRNCDSACYCDL